MPKGKELKSKVAMYTVQHSKSQSHDIDSSIITNQKNNRHQLFRVTVPANKSCNTVQSSCKLAMPSRLVPKELKLVDSMTSADFRKDPAAHLDNMRKAQKDYIHMEFFQKTIEINQHLFKDRIILVLHCGPGTIALMAARIGAKRVYAVDYSNVAGYAELVVKENHYETIIKVLNGHVSELQLPEKVDGIVCCWMGQCLLFDSDIVEVIDARERWLKPNGFILPDRASLYIMGSAEHELKENLCNWWLSVNGFNMNAMRQYSLAEPRFARTRGDKLLTMAHRVLAINLLSVGKDDLYVDRRFKLKVKQEGYLECFLFYFDVEFSRSHLPVKLSCNPFLNLSVKLLWHQTLLFVEQSFMLRQNMHYFGHLIIKPLHKFDLSQMDFFISFFESPDFDPDMQRNNFKRLVSKRWLMTECFQTFDQVTTCQDDMVKELSEAN